MGAVEGAGSVEKQQGKGHTSTTVNQGRVRVGAGCGKLCLSYPHDLRQATSPRMGFTCNMGMTIASSKHHLHD